MTLCEVTGTVVSTVKHPALTSHKLLACRPVDPVSGRLSGNEIVGLDTVQAGTGDRVLVCDEGNAARLILDDTSAPVRTVIVAVVDSTDVVGTSDVTGGSAPGRSQQRDSAARKKKSTTKRK